MVVYFDLLCLCIVHRAEGIFFCTVHYTHAQQVNICRHNTDNINNDTHIGTRYVILAKHWMWLPDDGFMWTETCWSSFYDFNYFNKLRILQFVCISWIIKCLIFSSYMFRHSLCAIIREVFTVVEVVLSKWFVVCSAVTLNHSLHEARKVSPLLLQNFNT